MIELRETARFSAWLEALKDRQARVRVQARLLRLRYGNPGQHRVLKAGVSELKSTTVRATGSITHNAATW